MKDLLRNKIWHSIGLGVDLLYPPACAGCGVIGRGWWCPACDAAVHRVSVDDVRDLELPGGRTLRCVAWAVYEPPLRDAIHALKYDGVPHVAGPLGRAMVAAWQASPLAGSIDLIVPTPLHRSRRRERGYNQSAKLAASVAQGLGVRMAAGALERWRSTAQQAQLDRDARQTNVAGAFRAGSKSVAGRSVLLIDDVMTTGATLRACAVALLEAGARDVAALTAARAI